MSDIYIPPGCKTVKELGDSQIRLGLQGFPFTGKTYASLTFPNPIILSLDRKVSAHNAAALVVPMHDASFIDSIVKRPGTQCPPQTKEAITTWLSKEGVKLHRDQTLIIDGSTAVEESYHTWFRYNEDTLALSKKGEYNKFIQWTLKKDYFGELFALFKMVPCNVIYIVHESEKSDKDGMSTGKIRPLMTGQVGDKMAGNFTDWFRCIVVNKPNTPEEIAKLKASHDVDDATLKEWIASSDPSYKSIHLWQTQGDATCDCGSSSMQKLPKYILATYESFHKYKRKQ